MNQNNVNADNDQKRESQQRPERKRAYHVAERITGTVKRPIRFRVTGEMNRPEIRAVNLLIDLFGFVFEKEAI